MSDLTEGLFKKKIPLSPFTFYSTCVIYLKVFHYIVCMYFFTINVTAVFFSVKHIELLDVRNALYK